MSLIEPDEAHAIARRFREQIGGAYEAVAAQIEHDHPRRRTVLKLGSPDLSVVGLFEGYGGLTDGVLAVTGGRLTAYAEWEPPTKQRPRPTQAPARIMAHRHPDLPNLGDVSAIDWAPWRHRVDVIAAGFPCQDVSVAGRQAGLQAGTRSGLWAQVARAIDETEPALVVIENVPGLRSARAGDPEEVTDNETDRDMESGDDDLGDPDHGDARPVRLRALGAVLGDLADRGYDCEWVSVRASDVGAPHRRERVFILAWAPWLVDIVAADV